MAWWRMFLEHAHLADWFPTRAPPYTATLSYALAATCCGRMSTVAGGSCGILAPEGPRISTVAPSAFCVTRIAGCKWCVAGADSGGFTRWCEPFEVGGARCGRGRWCLIPAYSRIEANSISWGMVFAGRFCANAIRWRARGKEVCQAGYLTEMLRFVGCELFLITRDGWRSR